MTPKQDLLTFWKQSRLITNSRLLEAFETIKRERFVPDAYKDLSYEDAALPLGHDATISQPTTIMIMLQALDLQPGNNVLEIGTGSGYTAALTARLIHPRGTVHSLEIVQELVERARENLEKEGITNARLYCKNGKEGFKEQAPFDRIIVHAACRKTPKIPLDQLKPDGILVAPIGPALYQQMIKFTKYNNGIVEEYLGEFIFVPLH